MISHPGRTPPLFAATLLLMASGACNSSSQPGQSPNMPTPAGEVATPRISDSNRGGRPSTDQGGMNALPMLNASTDDSAGRSSEADNPPPSAGAQLGGVPSATTTGMDCQADMGGTNGACIETECEPEAQICRAGDPYECGPSGMSASPSRSVNCGERTCIDGECRPIKHNIMVLFDTSESMNQCVTQDNQSYVECCNGDCPGEWPICETPDKPLSRLGYSKRVFQRFFAEQRAQEAARFALLTFPQTTTPFNNGCYGSLYDFSNIITDDDGLHATDKAWFTANQGEVVRVPFATSWQQDNIQDILEWVDFTEENESNPELRATGLTPLGRSMFYAGEYMRHAVIAEGRTCELDSDCGSQDYVCAEGTCTDPLKHCRLNMLLVFTDGKESTHPLVDQFFNPVVQARRMKFGLRCDGDGDCLAGALCDDGYCRREMTRLDACMSDEQCPTDAFCQDGRCEVPGFLWPTDQGRCADAGNPCVVSSNQFPEECAGFFEACVPVDPLYWDRAQGANLLKGANEQPISITTHVINVSDDVNESKLIASHGGGLHFKVDLNDEEVLLRILNRIVDYKRGGAKCVLEGD